MVSDSSPSCSGARPPTLRLSPSKSPRASSSPALYELQDQPNKTGDATNAGDVTATTSVQALSKCDSEWSSIFGGLSTALDDAAMDVSSPAPTSASAGPSTMFFAPECTNKARKRTRTRSHKRSLSVGAEPNSFASPESLLPLRLDPGEELPRGQRIPIRAISGFHPHLYTLRLSSSRPVEEPPPQLSRNALLASPIHLGGKAPAPLKLPVKTKDSEPQSESHTSAPIPFPGASPSSPAPEPEAPDHLSPSGESSPGSWLRSPTMARPRFRSDGSDADAIMFTPRQLEFEDDSGPLVTSRRLWSQFDGGPEPATARSLPGTSLPISLQGGFQSMALGPAFEPSECSCPTEPLSPAFALETEPGLSKS
ncbi:hypothetical protein CC85DRAFT_281456 [Cutaneotrichosporon oleaginosum]|uniref:Uncharacterized protein n=1 Tax=Cutaneotrichosporon oleaginosum TaxID=879819 RepID=A0A0J0XZ78_9TREE|nr:uncharacterized protein CC85DRAFT_281456 [Cutaneotrichosporon oleaginosum]KLT46367.1 hypothetical protein CC85DRAFT_281456 [Cutaneotrichosporon oleaginosum]TXT15263.1 hypothetical protein COLE_01456 [Cutaneotrichosporon oleaginosum]